MADSFAVEIYENQFRHRKKGWISYKKNPFILRSNLSPTRNMDELSLPEGSGWCWFSNWKIIRNPDCTDEEGWEYATRFSRFKKRRRIPRYEAGNRRARRRLWVRTMVKDYKTGNNINLPKVVVKIRRSLTNIRVARNEIENILFEGSQQDKASMFGLLESIFRLMEEFSQILAFLQKKNQFDEEQHGITASDVVNSFLLTPSAKSEDEGDEIEKLLSVSALLSNLTDDLSREKVFAFFFLSRFRLTFNYHLYSRNN
jgi:hypothetical protein